MMSLYGVIMIEQSTLWAKDLPNAGLLEIEVKFEISSATLAVPPAEEVLGLVNAFMRMAHSW